MNILEALRGLVASREERQVATFGFYVEEIASGRDVNAAEVLTWLDKNGLTVADLDRAVKEELQQRSLREQAEAGRLAEHEIPFVQAKIKAEVAEFDEKFKALDALYGKRVQALREREKLLGSVRETGRRAEQKLRDTAPVEIKRRMQELRESRMAVVKRREGLRESAFVNRTNLGRAEQSVEQAETPELKQHYASQVESINARLAQIEADRVRLEEQQRGLDEEISLADREMVERN